MSQVVSFYPGGRFPALSVTGDRCKQQCDHCRGHYLRGMSPLIGPQSLLDKALELHKEGAEGFLLSGGCDRDGRVPLTPYLPTIREVKERTSLRVNVHTGLVGEDIAPDLLSSGADCFSVDVVQDEIAIRQVLHLKASAEEYARTLELLSSAPRLVPHICVGLQSEEGERKSLELISKYDIASLVVLGLVPARGTPWDGRTENHNRLVSFIKEATLVLDAPVLVGCMRPRGQWETELECIEAGATGIVNPSLRTLEAASALGYTFEKREACCSFYL